MCVTISHLNLHSLLHTRHSQHCPRHRHIQLALLRRRTVSFWSLRWTFSGQHGPLTVKWHPRYRACTRQCTQSAETYSETGLLCELTLLFSSDVVSVLKVATYSTCLLGSGTFDFGHAGRLPACSGDSSPPPSWLCCFWHLRRARSPCLPCSDMNVILGSGTFDFGHAGRLPACSGYARAAT
jgi:hypothetical protein